MCPAPRPSPYTCPTAFSRVLPAMWSCHTHHRRRRNPKFARPGARGRVAEGDSSIVLPPTAQPNPTQNGRNRKPLYETRLLRRPRPSEASKVPRKAQRRAGQAKQGGQAAVLRSAAVTRRLLIYMLRRFACNGSRLCVAHRPAAAGAPGAASANATTVAGLPGTTLLKTPYK